jgi:hypothetical protein
MWICCARRRCFGGTARTSVGAIFAAQLAVTVGQCVHDLELIAKVYEPTDIASAVERLPLK